ncbi:hypothetical protein EV368DRAFT_69494 [Lentinula lateritia]|nr:hypothetical protein EV368DRAFT_69494 [Lentinula lateritia]
MSLRRRTRALVPVAAGPSTATSDPSTATSDPSTVTSNPSTAVSDPGFSNTHSTPVILMQQARTLNLLNEKVASLEEARQLLEDELKEETLLQEAEYQCPLCLDLAWYPYVTACGHCFCSRCLSEYKANHDRKRLEDPIGADVIIRCPACRASILRKPLHSVVIQQGIEQLAVDLQINGIISTHYPSFEIIESNSCMIFLRNQKSDKWLDTIISRYKNGQGGEEQFVLAITIN